MNIDDDSPLWGFVAILLNVVFSRLINGRYPWERPIRKTADRMHVYPDLDPGAIAKITVSPVSVRPKTKHMRESRHHHEPISSASRIAGVNSHFCSHRPLVLPRGDHHKQRSMSIKNKLNKRIKESNKSLAEGKYHKEWLEKRLDTLTRSQELLQKTRSTCGSIYRDIASKTLPLQKRNAKKFEKVLSTERKIKDAMKKRNTSLMSKISGSQNEREHLRKSVKAITTSHMDNLLKTQRDTQEKAIQGHQLSEKLRIRGYLSKKIGGMLREKEDICRYLQREIFDLKCHYVTEMDYGREFDKTTVAKSLVKSLGYAVMCGIQAIIFMLWAF